VGADPFEIRFHSDGAVQQTGFKLSVVLIDRQVKTAREFISFFHLLNI